MNIHPSQFCWECGGPFHTVVSCSRPRIIADAGSILAFDDLDKRCASHFLSRQVAQNGRQRCLRLLGKCEGGQGLLSDLKVSGRVGRHNHVAGRSRLVQSGCKRHRTESRDECDDAEVLRVKAEGWAVLADAQVSCDIFTSHKNTCAFTFHILIPSIPMLLRLAYSTVMLACMPIHVMYLYSFLYLFLLTITSTCLSYPIHLSTIHYLVKSFLHAL